MDYENLELLIDGNWTKGTSSEKENVVNPATEEVLGVLPHASEFDLESALQASQHGFENWSMTTAVDRQKILERAAQLIEERRDIITVNLTREMGKPLKEAKIELDFAIGILRWYGEEGKRAYGRIIPSRVPGMNQYVVKEPVGPVAGFVAWNFPAVNVIRKVAGALGAGCSIILKASEETPGTCIAIARCFMDAGLPSGVINLVFGKPANISEYLLASPIIKKVSFTGSIPIGKHIQKLAAETMKRCTLELGGHSPFIVFKGTDIKKTAKSAAQGKFRNAGQVCVSPTRFYIEESVYQEFTESFVDQVKKINVGDGILEDTSMGPVIAERRLTVMEDFVSDASNKGAEVLSGGQRVGNQGFFFEPTVLKNVPDDAKIMTEEPFGPIAPLNSFSDEDEIIKQANALPFGLAAYAYTNNKALVKKLANKLQSGMVAINSQIISTPETPFGGIKESGYGSEGGIEGLEAYLKPKFISES
jgi:succinate-semialdehyde dehydrogenase/glutarate-semialdehyde dehydrogenase